MTHDETPDDVAADLERIAEVAARVTESGRVLRALGPDRVARTLGEASTRLASPDDDLGRRAREWLPEATGLSSAMVNWALRTNVAPYDADALRLLVSRLQPPRTGGATRLVPPRLVAVTLAGNVFTASLRSIALPLLSGAPVVAKASSHDDAFPRLLERALREIDPEIAPCLSVLTFAGGTHTLEEALFSKADVVSAYGSDHTLAQLRARVPSTTRFIGHGHGLGVLYVSANALEDPSAAREVATRAALDVAAFDQRGCLSPHAIWAQSGGPVEGRTFARLLAEQLSSFAQRWPRGPLPTSVGAAQLQWRGVAAVQGELFEGDGYAVSWEPDGALRLSPGWRNVQVLSCPGPQAFDSQLTPLGMHLKCVGVAGPTQERHHIAETLSSPLAPRVVPAGTMQTPPVDVLAEGESPWSGLVRWREIE